MPAVSTEAVPRTVRIAGILTTLQAVAGLLFALVLLIGSGSPGSGAGSPLNRGDTFGEVGYYVVLSVAILAVGIGLWRGKHWTRTPTLLLQLLLIGVAWYAVGPSKQPLIGLVIGAPALVVLWFLFNRAGRTWSFPAGATPDTDRK